MHTDHAPSDGVSIVKLMKRFPDEASAIEYFESLRWAKGAECPHCKNKDQTRIWKISADKEKKIRPGLRQCGACKKQFRVTIGTIFEDSHLPLNLWIIAWYLFAGAKKSISAKQMQRHLGLGSYKTAWFLCHRIRHAMTDPVFDGRFSGIVEVDETFVGGRLIGKGHKAGFDKKTPVVSLVERGGEGRKRSVVIPKVTAKNLRAVVMQNVEPGSVINTDELKAYIGLKDKFTHETVNHRQYQYVRKFKSEKTITTNTVEGSFSLLKRGIVGSFHHVSKKHLPRYVSEFDYRWNTRKKTDAQRMEDGLKRTEGKRLTYKPLTSSKTQAA